MAVRVARRPSKAILKLVSDKTQAPTQTDPPTVGAPSPRTIVYKALKTGRSKIKLDYIEPSGDKADTLAITVKVR